MDEDKALKDIGDTLLEAIGIMSQVTRNIAREGKPRANIRVEYAARAVNHMFDASAAVARMLEPTLYVPQEKTSADTDDKWQQVKASVFTQTKGRVAELIQRMEEGETP